MAIALRHSGLFRHCESHLTRHFCRTPLSFLPALVTSKEDGCQRATACFPNSVETIGHSFFAVCFGWPSKRELDWTPPVLVHSRSISSRSKRRLLRRECATEAPSVREEDAKRLSSGKVPQSATLQSQPIPEKVEPTSVDCTAKAPDSQAAQLSSDGKVELQNQSSLGKVEPNVTVQSFGLEEEDVIVSGWDYDDSDPEIRVLARGSSEYNSKIEVVDLARTADHSLAGATLLLLDTANNIHSVYFKDRTWTDSYYDDFATLPCLLPPGPIGLYGLGAGTAAHLVHHAAPERRLHAWELDPKVVAVARRYFDIAPLEANGFLTIHIGDALAGDAAIEGGFAGLIVDLFSRGAVLPELQEAATWTTLIRRLRPGGRIMVNCGSAAVEPEVDPRMDRRDKQRMKKHVKKAALERRKYGEIVVERVLEAMDEALKGQVCVRTLGKDAGCSVLALSGELPPKQEWAGDVLTELRPGIATWEQYKKRT